MENIYHTIRGRTKSPRTLESNSKDPLSAAKPNQKREKKTEKKAKQSEKRAKHRKETGFTKKNKKTKLTRRTAY